MFKPQGGRMKASLKIASIILLIHGFIEIIGSVMLFALPAGALAFKGFQGRRIFMAILSAIYGFSRVIAGYQVWLTRRWGIAFGITLSLVTMITSPSIYPYGVMDLPSAILVLALLLHAWFSGERL
jgi:hypothetical protein